GAPKIIWIGVGKAHPHLFQIHKRVQESALAAGLEPDLRPWHPHVTIARCRDVSAQSLRKFLHSNAEFDAGMIRVEAFHLYSSKLTPSGPIHTRELTVNCSRGRCLRCAAANDSGYNPLLESGAATCSRERRSAGTPIHASMTAPKIISAAATKYPTNNAVIDPVPMIHPNRSGAPTPPASVPIA